MFPPPITSATSRPFLRTSTSSSASLSTTSASRPYSFEPMRDSPESLSRRRLNGIALGDGVPGVVEELDAALLQILRDRARSLVRAVPRLFREHRLAEELLVQLALDDLVADVLGLREDFLGVRQDLALGLHELGRHLVARAVRRPGEGEVQCQAARSGGVSALRAHDRADLVRRPVHVV